MKKRRRSGLMAPSPATPHMQMKWSAESMARTALDTHPMMKRAKDQITSAVLAATEKALKTTLKDSSKKA